MYTVCLSLYIYIYMYIYIYICTDSSVAKDRLSDAGGPRFESQAGCGAGARARELRDALSRSKAIATWPPGPAAPTKNARRGTLEEAEHFDHVAHVRRAA